MNLDELEKLAKSLDYHNDDCTKDNDCYGRFPDVDACTMVEVSEGMVKLIAVARAALQLWDGDLKSGMWEPGLKAEPFDNLEKALGILDD